MQLNNLHAEVWYTEDHIWALKVSCPYCREVHWHMGGEATRKPDTGGLREAKCGRGDYTLAEPETFKAWDGRGYSIADVDPKSLPREPEVIDPTRGLRRTYRW